MKQPKETRQANPYQVDREGVVRAYLDTTYGKGAYSDTAINRIITKGNAKDKALLLMVHTSVQSIINIPLLTEKQRTDLDKAIGEGLTKQRVKDYLYQAEPFDKLRPSLLSVYESLVIRRQIIDKILTRKITYRLLEEETQILLDVEEGKRTAEAAVDLLSKLVAEALAKLGAMDANRKYKVKDIAGDVQQIPFHLDRYKQGLSVAKTLCETAEQYCKEMNVRDLMPKDIETAIASIKDLDICVPPTYRASVYQDLKRQGRAEDQDIIALIEDVAIIPSYAEVPTSQEDSIRKLFLPQWKKK